MGRKPKALTKSRRMIVTLAPGQKERLMDIAWKERLSIAEVIRELIEWRIRYEETGEPFPGPKERL